VARLAGFLFGGQRGRNRLRAIVRAELRVDEATAALSAAK
jgi:hypothetical protein